MIKKVLFVLVGTLILAFFIYMLYNTDNHEEETGTLMELCANDVIVSASERHSGLC